MYAGETHHLSVAGEHGTVAEEDVLEDRPKSMTTGWSPRIRTLEGFRSRCITPCSCV
jgi:hypothetical protein